ncbi:unnamed protein product [Clonostachys rosea f. rosea IK726]|uniref:Uncharacterized protein n=1 Tax=Clonostachys rosea f. rosea IK726 TaxID=1349383 RepID=A0ACA9UFU6_BIOOC|nr:unnamed protein product [Clonostachys rosea f. rosea IK726]
MAPLSSNKTWTKLAHHLKALDPVSVALHLDDHVETKIYTPGSIISGRVDVTTDKDFAFDTFNIDFMGETTTNIQTSFGDPRHTRHIFLKLSMPLSRSVLPESKIFEAYQTHSIPFTFTVPYHLPSKACKHTECEDLHERHLCLPPSMGYWEGKDQSPNAARIDYNVRVMLTPRPGKNGKQGKPTTTQRSVKVLPTQFAEAASPVSAHTKHPLTKDRSFHQDLLSQKTGDIKVSTSIPEPVVLSVEGSQVSDSMLTVNVEFTPQKGEAALPDLHAKSMQVEAHTHYSFAHVNLLPDREDILGSLPMIVPFFTSNKMTVQPSNKLVWETQSDSYKPSKLCRRDSGAEIDDLSDEDQASTTSGELNHQKKYTATLQVPISLPVSNKKLFLPSFYSCIISRTYNLRLVLGAGSLASTIILNVPLEVVVEGAGDSAPNSLPDYAHIDLEDVIPLEALPSYTP